MNPTLYACIGSGNCFKPFLAMQQLGISFDLELVDVLAGEQKSPAYLAINPRGVVPFLRTSEGVGIGESNAMLWYLCENSHLMPKTAAERAQALQWLFFEQSKLEPFISPARFFTTIVPSAREEKAKLIARWVESARLGLAHLNSHLDSNKFILANGYSLADIGIFGYVHVMVEAGIEPGDYPSVVRWMERVAHSDGFVPLSELGKSQMVHA